MLIVRYLVPAASGRSASSRNLASVFFPRNCTVVESEQKVADGADMLIGKGLGAGLKLHQCEKGSHRLRRVRDCRN